MKLHNSGGEPKENVRVSTYQAIPSFTDSKGYFELVFNGKRTGSLVRRIEIQLDGYKLINEEKAEDVIIPEDPSLSPIYFSIANIKEYEEKKAKYYNIVVSRIDRDTQKKLNELLRYQEEYKERLDRIDDQLTANEENQRLKDERDSLLIALEASNLKIRDLDAQRKLQIERADKLAEQFLKIDLDEASEMIVEALRLFEEGKVEEAMETISDERLSRDLVDTRNQLNEMEQRLLIAQRAYEKSIANYITKARLSKSIQKIDEAKTYYDIALKEDNTNIEVLDEVAEFYAATNGTEEAVKYYNSALALVSDDSKKIEIYIQLAELYAKTYDFDQANTVVQSAIDLYFKDGQNNEIPDSKVAKLLIAKGDYDDKRRKEFYLKARAILDNTSQDKQDENWRGVNALYYNNMGQHYYVGNEKVGKEGVSLIIEYFKKSIEIYESLSANGNDEYKHLLGSGYNDLGSAFVNENKKKIEYYKKALEVFNSMSTQSSEFCEMCRSVVQQNLAMSFIMEKKYEKAESLLIASNQTLERLSLFDVQYKDRYASSLSDLGDFYFEVGLFELALKSYIRSLEMYQELDESYVDWHIHLTEIADLQSKIQAFGRYFHSKVDFLAEVETYSFKGGANTTLFYPSRDLILCPYDQNTIDADLSILLEDYEASIKMLKKAKKDYKETKPEIVIYYLKSGIAQLNLGKRRKADIDFNKSLDVIENEFKKYIHHSPSQKLGLLSSKAIALVGINELQKADLLTNEIRQDFSSTDNPLFNRLGYGRFLVEMGKIYYYKGNYEMAEKYLLESISIQQDSNLDSIKFSSVEPKKLLAITYRELGIVYLNTDLEKAIAHLTKATEIFDSFDKEIDSQFDFWTFQQIICNVYLCEALKSSIETKKDRKKISEGYLISLKLSEWRKFDFFTYQPLDYSNKISELTNYFESAWFAEN